MSESPPLAPRSVDASRTVMTELIFPEHANALGKAFGGQVMAWTDLCGGMCSMRHTGGITVTAAVDELQFQLPLAIGDMAIIEARVNATFRTSLEVQVTVDGENPMTGGRWRCVDALMTFVAIDAAGRPRDVPPLLVATDDERRRHADATDRREARLRRRHAEPLPR